MREPSRSMVGAEWSLVVARSTNICAKLVPVVARYATMWCESLAVAFIIPRVNPCGRPLCKFCVGALWLPFSVENAGSGSFPCGDASRFSRLTALKKGRMMFDKAPPRSFPDTEFAENAVEQVIASCLAGDFPQ